jgi:hypothetical protein
MERAWTPMGQVMRVVVGLAVVIAAAGCGPRRETPQDNPATGLDASTAPTTRPLAVVETTPATAPSTMEDNATTQPAIDQATTLPTTTLPTTTQPAETVTTQPATTEPVSTQPATTQAATQPAAAVETPRQVLAGVMNSTFRGDADAVRSRLHVSGDESQRLADAMADVARAVAKVREAAVARFGEEEARKLDIDIVPDVAIASAEQRIENDKAFVKLQGRNGNGIAFQKIDGTWKLSLPDLIESQKQGRNIDQLVNDTRAPVARFEDLAKRVNEGQFQTAEQLLGELAQTFFSTQQR